MALREILASFGFDFDSKAVEGAQTKIGGLVDGLKGLAGALAGGALVAGITRFVSANIAEADAVGDLSVKLGISAQRLQEFQTAAGLVGSNSEALTLTFKALAKTAYDAANGGAETAAAFKDLGVDVADSSGKILPVEELFLRTGGAIGSLTDATKRSAVAAKLLGKSGVDLLGFFKDGEEGARALLARVSELGGGFSDDFVEAAGKADDELKIMAFVLRGLKGQIALAVVPAVTRLIAFMSKWIGVITKTLGGTNALKAAWLILTAVAVGAAVKILAKYRPLLLTFGKWLGIFLLLVLIVDDLITLFQGGESAIGAFIDAMFGVGSAKALVEELSGIWSDFVNVVLPQGAEIAREIWSGITEILSQAVEGWQYAFSLFGEWLSGFWAILPEPVQEVIATITALFTEMFDWIAEKVKGLLPDLSGLFGVIDEEANRKARKERTLTDAANVVVNVPAQRIGAPATKATVTQRNETTINVNAPGANPGAVGRAVGDAVQGANRHARRAALAALESG